MTWDPDGKITNFGQSFETMLIPDSSDPVASDDDPGGTPIAISAMTTASGIAFGKITNNIQFIKKRVLTEDLTLTINSAADFLSAKATIAEIQHIDDGVTLLLDFAASYTLIGNDTYFPLEFHGITGGGGFIKLLGESGSPFVLSSTGDYGVLDFQDVDPAVTIQYGEVDTSSTAAINLVNMEQCKAAVISNFEFSSVTTGGDVVGLYTSGFGTIALTSVTWGQYYETALKGEYGKIINIVAPFFNIPTSGGKNIDLNYGCRLFWTALDDSHFQMGSLASETSLFSIDSTCEYRVLSFGTAGTVTMPDNGATYILRDLQRFLNVMPKRIDTNVVIEIPDKVADNSLSDVVVDGFYSVDKNVELRIRAVNTVSGPSQAQNVTFDVDGASAHGIEIQDCDIDIVIDSIKFDSDDGHGIYVKNSRLVTIQNCYLLTTTVTGDDGINFTDDCNGMVDSCMFGICGNNGIEANYRSHIHGDTCEQVDGTNQPDSYGILAQTGSVISYNSTGWTLSGGSGAAYSATGGETRS